LLDGYLSFRESGATPFTTPGHKGRAALLDVDLGKLVAGDVPLYGGIDTVKSTRGLLTAAERRAADWYGADWCLAGRRTGTRPSASRSANRDTRSS
jgi:lysine decarboxylase